jgi:hypothetical protein
MENKPLRSLKKAEQPKEEERGSSEEEAVAALETEAVEGGREMYCFLG